jgi:hypothetical protein
MSEGSDKYRLVCAMSGAKLAAAFTGGRRPEPAELAGWEWRGTNTPMFTNVLGIKRFIKGMFLGDGVEGYNIPVKGKWTRKPSEDSPKRFGFYRVVEDDGRHPGSILLDYGASPRNARWQPERLLRDYVKDLGDGVLLGRAYLAFGPEYVPVSWFVIEKLRRTDWKPAS